MSIMHGYATLAELKSRLGIDSTDQDDDAVLEAVVMAVSRWIDAYTGRRFFRTSEDESRYYTAEWGDMLCPDDIGSLTTLYTDADGDRTYETTWANTDYVLLPANAALDGRPYTQIALSPVGRYSFPTHANGVKLTGKFGYSAMTPPVIREACLLQSARIFKRKDAVFGVMGSAEMGQQLVIPKLDPDVAMMLQPYLRLGVGAV